MDYDKLREWMTSAPALKLNAITKAIIEKYFQE